MKAILMLLTVCLLATGVSAQSKTKHKKSAGHKMKDCIMMDNNKLVLIKGGQKTGMYIDRPMRNGNVVLPDGTVKIKDGETVKLNNGDCVLMDGTITRKKM